MLTEITWNLLLERISAVEPPDFEASDSVHGLLADLPLPVYVTTAYDNYLVQALKTKNRDPRQELCRWNRFIPEVESAFDEKGFKPTVANPVVFHLHGHDRAPESMVITEDEYLDFLVNTSRDGTMIPPRIKEAFTKTTQRGCVLGRQLYRDACASQKASCEKSGTGRVEAIPGKRAVPSHIVRPGAIGGASHYIARRNDESREKIPEPCSADYQNKRRIA